MEIEQPDSHVDAELLAERQLECAYAEADTNGAAIDWRYWVEQLPMLSAGQAARLMKGLDPVAFSDLSARPTKADPTELCKHALMLEQLAIAQGKTTDTQHGWLAWAAQHKFKVHPAFRDEVNAKPLTAPAQTPTTPAPVVETDYSLLATPAELLDAFEKWGLVAAWFDDLNSHKWLLDARRKKGQGQRGHVIEPLFCPFDVMNGLIGKVRKTSRLKPDTAWRTLEHKFPEVYAAFQEHDPREVTGD